MANRVTPYTPTNWQNLPTKTTPLNKTNLDHIEQGIKTVTDGLNMLPDLTIDSDGYIDLTEVSTQDEI